MSIDLEKLIEHLDSLSEEEARSLIEELLEDEQLDEEVKETLTSYEPKADEDDSDKPLEEDKTPAANTLRPGGAPGESKAKTLDTFVQLLGQLGKEDLSNLFNQVQSQFGPNSIPGAVDNSAKNRSTLDMKPSAAVGKGAWKEDLDVMFSGDELTEEQKDQAATIFEAAVSTRVALVEADLEEQYETAIQSLEEQYAERLEEETSEIFETITTKLDQYLDHVVEAWVEENAVAIETALRVEIAENFIESLKGLFTEHYIKVPENKLDIVADINGELEAVKEELDRLKDENLELSSIAEAYVKSQIVSEMAEGLTDVEADKLVTLSEGLEFTDEEGFRKKVGIIKEKYFTGTPSNKTGLLTEDMIDDASTDIEDPAIQAVAKAISSRNKF